MKKSEKSVVLFQNMLFNFLYQRELKKAVNQSFCQITLRKTQEAKDHAGFNNEWVYNQSNVNTLPQVLEQIKNDGKIPATIFHLIEFLKSGKIPKKWKGYKIAFLGTIPASKAVSESRDILYIFYDETLQKWVLQCNVFPNSCPNENIFFDASYRFACVENN